MLRTTPNSKGKIVVTGMCCFLPSSGVVYQVLHYMVGLRRLGYDPYYVEISRRWIYNLDRHTLSPDAASNVSLVAAAFEAFGFADRWAFRGDYPDGRCYGMTEAQVVQLYREADALLNVTGQEIQEEQLACPCRIYIESDPFATQVRVSQGDAAERARLLMHHVHFSFGENIGAPDCSVPDDGFHRLPTRQPVDMGFWKPDGTGPAAGGGGAYTTITSWISRIESVVYKGEAYHWQKHLEFEKFLELPRRCPVPFELALEVEPEIHRMLCARGWRPVLVTSLSADIFRYRDYIWRSRAEFTVARDQYIRPYTGWFSDRSACYLAAARPVIMQETGFSKFLPTGRGLFAFRTMEEILAAVDAIETDYEAHSRAAREIAVEYFAAEKVVGSLMQRAGF